jgi:nucleoside-triphosphatase
MGRTWLLTGRPGVGKTTCLRRVLDGLRRPAGGFLTDEVRAGGTRVGFALVTLDGRRAMLAHVERRGSPRVGKYGVDVEALDRVGVPAIRAAIEAGRLVVVDEIGKMELASAAFRSAVDDALASAAPVLGTVMATSRPWVDRIKARRGVTLIEVTAANRDRLPARLLDLVEEGAAVSPSFARPRPGAPPARPAP